MKYFEDVCLPLITPNVVRVDLDTPKWCDTKVLKVWRFTMSYFEGFIEPQYLPGQQTRYHADGGWIWVQDDYGNLVICVNEDGVMPVVPMSILIGDDWRESVVLTDDFGTNWCLEDDEDNWYLSDLDECGTPQAAIEFGNNMPGSWKLEKPKIVIQPEFGWDVLHSHATMDGMLCVRWLNLYGSVPDDEMPFNYQKFHHPTWGYAVHGNRHTDQLYNSRRASRKMFQHETSGTREVAAECFPMEIGSLLARRRYQEQEQCCIGVVYDPQYSELRQIYAEDCYSWYVGNTLKTGRDWINAWEGWGHARTAWNALSAKRRLYRLYTEGFVKNPIPVALVVYGNPEDSMQDTMLIKKFRKNGYPVYLLNPTSTES